MTRQSNPVEEQKPRPFIDGRGVLEIDGGNQACLIAR